MFKFTEVACCKESLALSIDYEDPKNIKKCVKGDLDVMIEVSSGMLMFKMD